jgi:hypothetical protein
MRAATGIAMCTIAAGPGMQIGKCYLRPEMGDELPIRLEMVLRVAPRYIFSQIRSGIESVRRTGGRRPIAEEFHSAVARRRDQATGGAREEERAMRSLTAAGRDAVETGASGGASIGDMGVWAGES